MRVSAVHINESDVSGGAARSAYRLHDALRAEGHTSRMLVGRKLADDADVRPIKRSIAWRAADRAVASVTDRLDLQYVFYPSSFALGLDPWVRAANVVQLHIAHGSYFSHTALPLLSRKRPVVWLLHDMWAFTGHVAYSYECERWRHGCGACPYLHEYPPLRRDTTALLWRIKRAAYRRSDLTVVAPSAWLAGLARESPLLGGFATHHVPNGVDLDVFRPRSRREARDRLGLEPDRRVVLVAAARLDDRRKGLDLFARALRHLDGVDFDVLVAGSSPPALPARVRLLGELSSEDEMAWAYAAADVFVLPTRADNLPNTLLESIACGTPCVAFAVGGVPEVVRAGETGYAARPEDAADLARGIRELLESGERLRESCRAVAASDYGVGLQAGRMIDLYHELLSR